MLIEQALMTFLLAQSSITALVGKRIYFLIAPQDVTKPYIVVSKISSPRLHTHDGAMGLADARFQFSIFDNHYGDCKTIAAAIQSALQGYKGTMGGAGGVAVGYAFYDDETDLYEENGELSGVACDYIIGHSE